ADRVEGHESRVRRRPAIPDRMSTRVARVVGFAGLFRGADVAASDRAGGAADELAVGEVIVGGVLVQRQDDVTGDAVLAVHGNVISRAGEGSNGHPALPER